MCERALSAYKMSVEYLSVRNELLLQKENGNFLKSRIEESCYPNASGCRICSRKRWEFQDSDKRTDKSDVSAFSLDSNGLCSNMATINTIYNQSHTHKGRTNMTNRCISSNIIVVHSEDGKPPVITKQSTFTVSCGPGEGNSVITRIEDRVESSEDESFTSSDDSSSETISSLEPEHQILRVRSLIAKTSHDALRLALRHLGWREQAKPDGLYDLYWHGIAFEDCGHGDSAEIFAINKLPGLLELSHKVQLSRIIKRMQMLYPGEFDFYPTSWVIPEQYHQFIGEVGSAKSKNGRSTPSAKKQCISSKSTFIVKPDQGRQGDGIYIVVDPRDVQSDLGMRPAIVQEYIDSPLLLEGYKFDLRIYVVISRLNPLEVYICKEGLARLCTTTYESPTKQNIRNSYMHLTNYSLNKNSEDFVQTNAPSTGSKRTLTSVEEVLRKQDYDVDQMRRDIQDIVVKTTLALLPDLAVWDHVSNTNSLTRCFQILGFDVMLTSDMTVYLLEVNAVPSLRIDAEQESEEESGVFETVISAVDEHVKVNLIKDTLDLIAMGEENLSTSCLKRVYPFDKSENAKTAVVCGEGSSQFLKDFQLRNRVCDEKCCQQNTHGSKKRIIAAHWEAHQEQNSVKRSQAPPACQRCRHCNAAIIKRIPHTVVKYKQSLLDAESIGCRKEKKMVILKKAQQSSAGAKLEVHQPLLHPDDVATTSDWRFFDHRISGSALLSLDRSPIINTYRMKEKSKKPLEEPQLTEDDLPYRKCPNCGGYLQEIVGPGILEERELCKTLQKIEEQRLPSTETTYVCRHNIDTGENATKMDSKPSYKKFSSTPSNTEISFPLSPSSTARTRTTCEVCRSNEGFSYSLTGSDKDYRSGRNPDVKRFGIIRADSEKIKEKTFSGYHVMVLRRAADVFVHFNGIKPSLTMGATSFRNMARRCHLCEQGSLPSVDILYIDILRQWQNYKATHGCPYYLTNTGETKNLKKKKAFMCQTFGLPFQGFIEALFRIANQRFRGETLVERMESLLLTCERNIAGAKKHDRAEKLRNNARNSNMHWNRPSSKDKDQRIRTANGCYPIYPKGHKYAQ